MEVRQFLIILQKQLCRMLLLALLVGAGGCIARIDGPYQGRVIDGDTNQPIEGVVAHGDWYHVDYSPVGVSHRYYDSQETLTDKNGEFKIPGMGWQIFSDIGEMDLMIFKAGYTQIEPTSWYLCINPAEPAPMTWDGKKLTVKLRRMTGEERYGRVVALPNTPNKKQRLLIIERNKEIIEIGRPQNNLLPVE